MTEVTKGGEKSITTVPGVQVVYLSTVANGYTFTSRFGKVEAAFFQCGDTCGRAKCAVSGSVVTIGLSDSVATGYLQVWGE